METNEIDDILQGLGVSVPPSPPTPSPSSSAPSSEDNAEENSTYSEDDISSILEENGFTHEAPEEDGSEDIDDTDAMERRSESEDYNPTLGDVIDEIDAPESHGEDSDDENWEEEDDDEGEEVQEESAPASTMGNELPANSPTILLDESTSRFSGTEWYDEIRRARILIGGCGGIGSNLVFQLARMTPANITIYDDDIVEMANMAGQLFSISDIGKAKVDAMAQMITGYTTMRQVNAIRRRFTPSTEPGDIMMCGFDNMVARKMFFQAWKRNLVGKSPEERAKCLYLDGRLSIDTLQVLCIKGDDAYNIERYGREFLFDDSQADATVCSMKQTTYLACMIGSLMTNLFTNFIAGTLNPIIPYDLPFFTEYDAQSMIFKTES